MIGWTADRIVEAVFIVIDMAVLGVAVLVLWLGVVFILALGNKL